MRKQILTVLLSSVSWASCSEYFFASRYLMMTLCYIFYRVISRDNGVVEARVEPIHSCFGKGFRGADQHQFVTYIQT